MYILRVTAILICSIAVNVFAGSISSTYSWFVTNKVAKIKADVYSEDQMFNIDIKYKVWKNVNGKNQWVVETIRVMGDNIAYNGSSPITNPIQIVVTPTVNTSINQQNITQVIYFELQENLQNYMLHINPIKFSGTKAQTFININTRLDQATDPASPITSEGYTAGYLKIRYLNGVIEKSINIQFPNSEIRGRSSDDTLKQWYDVIK
jgi:hypothetical protein